MWVSRELGSYVGTRLYAGGDGGGDDGGGGSAGSGVVAGW